MIPTNRLIGFILVLAVGLPISARAADTSDRQKLDQRLENAQRVLEEINGRPIPDAIANMAKCVAIVPGLVKGAFIVGAEYGQGVATCRTEHGWSGPVFIRLAGGSFGFQVGGKGTDLVLVAVNQRGMQSLLQSKFKIGGTASAAAGPVGRETAAATDISMRAGLLTWSKAHGLFAGVDLNGVSVSQNAVDTNTLYGTFHNFDTILNGRVPPPPGSHAFLHTVTEYFGGPKESEKQHKKDRHELKQEEDHEEGQEH